MFAYRRRLAAVLSERAVQEKRIADLKEAHQARISDLKEARQRYITDLKEAHEREVTALKQTLDMFAEQIEFLRAVGGRPQPFPQTPSVTFAPMEHAAVPTAPSFEGSLVMSEEEEDVRAMHSAGLLDHEELTAALAQLGYPVEIAQD